MSKAALPAMAKTAPPTGAGRRQAGVALLAMLIVIAAMSAALGVTGSLWHEVQQREKERDLLFVGMQYRLAIKRYYESPGGQNKYPLTLDVLLLDERTPAIRRHLRKPWRDPLTNSKEWGLLLAPQGGIIGVHSLANGKPIKQENFPAELEWEGGKSRYIDWQFIYLPTVSPAAVPSR